METQVVGTGMAGVTRVTLMSGTTSDLPLPRTLQVTSEPWWLGLLSPEFQLSSLTWTAPEALSPCLLHTEQSELTLCLNPYLAEKSSGQCLLSPQESSVWRRTRSSVWQRTPLV